MSDDNDNNSFRLEGKPQYRAQVFRYFYAELEALDAGGAGGPDTSAGGQQMPVYPDQPSIDKIFHLVDQYEGSHSEYEWLPFWHEVLRTKFSDNNPDFPDFVVAQQLPPAAGSRKKADLGVQVVLAQLSPGWKTKQLLFVIEIKRSLDMVDGSARAAADGQVRDRIWSMLQASRQPQRICQVFAISAIGACFSCYTGEFAGDGTCEITPKRADWSEPSPPPSPEQPPRAESISQLRKPPMERRELTSSPEYHPGSSDSGKGSSAEEEEEIVSLGSQQPDFDDIAPMSQWGVYLPKCIVVSDDSTVIEACSYVQHVMTAAGRTKLEEFLSSVQHHIRLLTSLKSNEFVLQDSDSEAEDEDMDTTQG